MIDLIFYHVWLSSYDFGRLECGPRPTCEFTDETLISREHYRSTYPGYLGCFQEDTWGVLSPSLRFNSDPPECPLDDSANRRGGPSPPLPIRL